MKNAACFALLLGFMLCTQISKAQEQKPDTNSALGELGRFVGTWEKTFTIYKSEWSPEEQSKTGTHSCKWILDDRHIQELGRDSDGSTYMTVYSYDATAKAYRASVFQSTGTTWQMTGTWDAGEKTFTWSHELGGGIRMTGIYQFVNPKEFKFSYIAKNTENNVLFRLEGTGKRTEAAKK